MKNTLQRAAVAVTAFFMVAALGAWFYQLSRTHSEDAVLYGNTPSVLYQASYAGHVNPQQRMRVVIGLKPRNEAALDKLIADQSNPASPNYRHFLTPQQFQQQFSPPLTAVQTAASYFNKHGLRVVSVSPNGLIMEVEGTSGQLEQTFGVHLNHYMLSGVAGFSDGVYQSNDHDPVVPTELASIVDSVTGLNDFAQFHSKIQHAPGKDDQEPEGYSPQDIARAYDYPNSNNRHAHATYSGAGHTVAIATAYGYNASDVNAYWKYWNIHRSGSLTNIAINGTTKKVDDETTLDLETVGAQAPGADVLMYIGADPSFKSFTLIFNQIVTDNRADVVSVSWGACESATGSAQIRTESTILKQAAAQGIAVFVAAGDDGAYDCRGKKPVYSVDYPSSDPNVTAVGGTTLLMWSDQRVFETAWTGAGGGVSDVFGEPSWQTGSGVPANAKRNTSDVAMDADPFTGYAFYFKNGWEGLGGTSVATPDWAALWTLSLEASGQRLGPASPIIYRLGSSPDYGNTFLDITSGDNGARRGPGFNAGNGYDHPTGWGVPKGTALVDWLVRDSRAHAATVPAQQPDHSPAPTTADPLPPVVIGPGNTSGGLRAH